MFFIMLPLFLLWSFWVVRRISWPTLGLLFLAGCIGAFFFQPFSVASVVAIIGAITLLAITQPLRALPSFSFSRPSFSADDLVIGATSLLSLGTIIVFAIIGRSGEALRSPWQVSTPSWFVLFFIGFIATSILALRKSPLALPSLALLGLTSTTVATLVFANGFGFDPFLHRGAIQALISTHYLHPLRILYSGYYGFVATLSTLLAVPLKTIDILLIPIASGLLPLFLYRSLLRVTDAKRATFAALGLLLAPYAFFTFSIPFSVTALCTVVTIAFSHAWSNDLRRQLQFLVLNILAAFFHPLIAIPTVLWIITVIVSRRTGRRIPLLLLGALLIGISIPAMLAFNNLQTGTIPFSMTLPWHNISAFIDLFRDPYRATTLSVPLWLSFLYSYEFWSLVPVSLLAMMVPLFNRTDRQRGIEQLPLFVGLFLGTLLVATNLQFHDVIWYEQQEFCFRILHVLWLLPLPLALQSLANIPEKRSKLLAFVVVLLAFHATVSWYFSYQHYNEKDLTSGPAVSDADYEAVEKIRTIANGSPFVVLADQMLSAAAIEHDGFDQNILFDGQQILRYPIPTGGVLYPFFMRMNAYPSRDFAEEVARRSTVRLVIFAVHDYWPYSHTIVSTAAHDADETFRINNGTITLLVYRFLSL